MIQKWQKQRAVLVGDHDFCSGDFDLWTDRRHGASRKGARLDAGPDGFVLGRTHAAAPFREDPSRRN